MSENGTTILDVLQDIRSAVDFKFRPFGKTDRDAFAGADPDSMITGTERFVYILSPDGTVTAIGDVDESDGTFVFQEV